MKIEEAKRILPLPRLMEMLGLGAYAKKSCKSPFREEHNASFGIFQAKNGEWRFKDHGTGEEGDAVDFLAKVRNCDNATACKEFIRLAEEISPSLPPMTHSPKSAPAPAPKALKPYDWNACVAGMTGAMQMRLEEERGYSSDYVQWLVSHNQIGVKDGDFAFPVTVPGSDTVVGCHYRTGDIWRYEPTGIGTHPLKFGDTDPKTMLVFESQWDAHAVADRLGFHEGQMEDAAFLVTRGASNGRQAGRINMDTVKRVIAFPQNDKPKADGTIPSEEWFKGVQESLKEKPVFRATVPATFKDANDWLLDGTVKTEKLHEILGAAERIRTNKLPPLRDMARMLSGTMPKPPPELVKNLLHRESKLIIGGTSKGKKTFCLLDLAISVATGTPWWGFPTTRGKVCYINFEIQEAFFAIRVKEICRVKGVELTPGHFMAWTLRGHAEGMERMIDDIVAELLMGDYDLIIFDPIYKALGDRDENKAGDVANLMNLLEKIAVKVGAAIAFGAHFSKGNQAGKESADRIGGSGVFARDPDTIMTMTLHEERDCFVVEPILRNFAPVEAFVIRWEYPLMKRDDALDPTALKQVGGKKAGGPVKEFTEDQILSLLPNEGFSTAEWCDLAHAKLGCSPRTFRDRLAMLRESGRIEKTGRKGVWKRKIEEKDLL
ncbi:MAG: AAA family ATPase [Verrucomicrobiia bacterium]